MTCEEKLAYLQQEWDDLQPWNRSYLMFATVDAGRQEVIPYLARDLDAVDPELRKEAGRGLGELQALKYRDPVFRLAKADSDPEVRKTALLHLHNLSAEQRDPQVLQLALQAYDDPHSSVGTKLVAGAVMMYQLKISHDDRGAPAWWNEDEKEWLDHASIARAVEETRHLLSESRAEEDGSKGG